MKHLHFDCSMGAAGDMIAASLYGLFPDGEKITEELNSIGIPGIEYSAQPVKSSSVSGIRMRVLCNGEQEHAGAYPEPAHHGRHAGIKEILALIDSLNMTDRAKEHAKAVYGLIAAAESEVHGCDMKDIHFHELGTMDAAADICAACFLIDRLSPERISATKVRIGFGEVKCAHGIMPVPAPATALLIRGIPVFSGDIECEMCTPTGAALLRHFVDDFGPMPDMTVESMGCGMGEREFDRPNCVRAVAGETENDVLELSCNVDDMSPEAVGFALEKLLEGGALDVWYESIGMKKFRPGVIISCLCRPEQREEMLRLVFKHTTTIGIRETLCRRYVMRRGEEIAETPYGKVRIKKSSGYGAERKKAEFEDLKRIAEAQDLSILELSAAVGSGK